MAMENFIRLGQELAFISMARLPDCSFAFFKTILQSGIG
jgi:hypothetical protein